MVAWELPVGGGGTRVAAAENDPKGISGGGVAGFAVVPAGANGPTAGADARWQPQAKMIPRTHTRVVMSAMRRIITGP